MSMEDFRGLVSAIITPFDETGAVKETAFRQLVEYQMSAGLHGLFVCGGGGEGVLMSVPERQRIAEIAVEQVAGRGKVIVHVGALSTRDAVALAQHAEGVGADGVAAIPPLYWGRDEASIVAFYARLAASVHVPVYTYHIPAITHIEITVPLMERLMTEAGIAGIKYTDHNLLIVQQLLDCGGGTCKLFYGRDEQILPALLYGAEAGIGSTYTMMPNLFVRLWNQFGSGDLKGASETQNQINRLIRAVIKFPGIAALKAACGLLGLDGGCVRGPNLELTPADRAALESDLKAAGFFDLVPKATL
jgi:N-acetylneuraminate lyase